MAWIGKIHQEFPDFSDFKAHSFGNLIANKAIWGQRCCKGPSLPYSSRIWIIFRRILRFLSILTKLLGYFGFLEDWQFLWFFGILGCVDTLHLVMMKIKAKKWQRKKIKTNLTFPDVWVFFRNHIFHNIYKWFG